MKTIVSYHLFILCMLMPIIGNAQLILVTGSIINEKTGNALVNVNVFESNSGIGTITNTSGSFSLMLKPGKAEFFISYEGFNDLSRIMVLKKDTSVMLSLVPVINPKLKLKDLEHQKTAEKLSNNKNQ